MPGSLPRPTVASPQASQSGDVLLADMIADMLNNG